MWNAQLPEEDLGHFRHDRDSCIIQVRATYKIPKKFYDIKEKFKQNVIELHCMHKTEAGERRKTLKRESLDLARDAKVLQGGSQDLARSPPGGPKAAGRGE
jgi:hypothetical protein